MAAELLRRKLTTITLSLIRIGVSLVFVYLGSVPFFLIPPDLAWIGIGTFLAYGIVTFTGTLRTLLKPMRKGSIYTESILTIAVVATMAYWFLGSEFDATGLLPLAL